MPGEPYKISGKEGKTMKEYEKPQREVIELSGTDIITTSCTTYSTCYPVDVPGYDDWFD